MANPRAVFNELLTKSVFKIGHFPSVEQEGRFWQAQTSELYLKDFPEAKPLKELGLTKNHAIDNVITEMLQQIGDRFCCPKFCIYRFKQVGGSLCVEVDGIACRECNSFSFCRCACVEFQKGGQSTLAKFHKMGGTFSVKCHSQAGRYSADYKIDFPNGKQSIKKLSIEPNKVWENFLAFLVKESKENL